MEAILSIEDGHERGVGEGELIITGSAGIPDSSTSELLILFMSVTVCVMIQSDIDKRAIKNKAVE